MSISTGGTHRPAPSDPHRTVSCRGARHNPPQNGTGGSTTPPDDYEVSFYPGFASHVHVNEHEVYAETPGSPFVLPSGCEEPWSSSAVTIRNTAKNFNVTLHIDDPQHMIHRIHVELLDPASKKQLKSAERGAVTAYQTAPKPDTIVVTNTPTLCPPEC
ncbi:hypothetical protein [Longimicrobium sp.]|uniref:hypothetical protein n=1 Tax=Longimicrobium sp. TaxID=2029185 RepID=UPI002C124B7E|nr:hypothetical protein [Longimicrobium sp.]HSU14249.1 hypothetical protein [Longimicrobium sp.]